MAVACVAGALPPSLMALEWPQEIDAGEGTIVIYQPQPENLTDSILSGRAAMSLELKGKSEPVFGAFWFTAKLDMDTDAGIALVRDKTTPKSVRRWRSRPGSAGRRQRVRRVPVSITATSTGLTRLDNVGHRGNEHAR
ncbi:MAG: hypothetical protein WA970_12770 [Gammaproteobacteria bacterium]